MRKLIALFFAIFLVFPLILSAQTTAGVASWALDRQFYIDALDNEQVYSTLLSDAMLEDILRNYFYLSPEADTQELEDILRSIISQDYLRDQTTTFINGIFDYLQGKTSDFEPMIDLQPVKSALTTEKQDVFLYALVKVLPTCPPDMAPGPQGSEQVMCKPVTISETELVEEYFKPTLPSILAQFPDEVSLGEDWQHWQEGQRWRSFMPGMAVPAGMLLAVLFLAFVAACFWYVAALIADESWRVRLQWLGWMLLIPSVLIFFIGLAVQSNYALYWMRFGLEQASFRGLPVGLGMSAALEAIITSALPRIANSFLMVGGLCGGLSLGLVFWGLAYPRKKDA